MAKTTGSIKIKLTVDDKGTVKIKQFGDTAQSAGKKSQKAFNTSAQTIGGFNERLRTGNQALTMMTTIVGGLVSAYSGLRVAQGILDIGKNFEQTMVTVGGVSRATMAELIDLEVAARTVGASTEKTANQAGSALKYMAMAGFEANQAIAALPEVTDLSTAGQLELARATDISTDMLGAFGKDVSYLTRMNDIFIGTITRANTNVEMLAEGFKYVAPVASQLGYSVENTSAMLGVLANAFIKGSDAGTDLRQALLRNADAAKKLGLQEGATLIEVLTEMKRRQLGVNEVVDMFGVIASKSVLVLMENIAGYEKLNEKLGQSQGEAKELAETMRTTVNVQMQKLWSAIEAIGLDIFDRYKEKISETIEQANSMLTKHSSTIVNVADSVGVLIGYLDDLLIAFTAVKLSTGVLTFFDSVAFSSGTAAAGVLALNRAFKALAPVVAGIISYNVGEWLSDWSTGVHQIESDIEKIKAHTVKMQAEIESRSKDLLSEQKIEASFKFDKEGISKDYIEQQKEVEDDVTEIVLNALSERLQGHLNVLDQWEAASRYSSEKTFEEQKQALDAEYILYQQHVEDLNGLDKWYLQEKKRLDQEQTSEQIKLYEDLVKAGHDEYIEPLIDAKMQILDAEQKQWEKILDDDQAAYDLRLAKEEKYIDSVINDIERVVDAEQYAANERLDVIEDLAEKRVEIEKEANGRIAQLGQFTNEPVGPGSGFTVWNGNVYRSEADAIAAIDRFRTEQETAQKAAEAAAREREQAVEQAANDTARALENASREATRMADAAQQAAERLQDSFNSSYENYQSYIIDRSRQDWGIDNWNNEYQRLVELFQEGMNQDSIDPEYQLNVLDDMLSTLKKIDQKEQQQIEQFKATFFNINDMIAELTYGEYAASTSFSVQQGRIDSLIESIASYNPDTDEYVQAVDTYMKALPDYLDFMKIYAGAGFQGVLDGVIAQLKEYQAFIGLGILGKTYSLSDIFNIEGEKLDFVWSEIVDIKNDYPQQMLSNVYQIINDYGVQSLKDLYQITNDYEPQVLSALYGIINDYGVQNLSDLYSIIEDYGEQSLKDLYRIINDYDDQSLKTLYRIINDYDVQSLRELYTIIDDYGDQSLKALYPIMQDYGIQYLRQLYPIYNDYGPANLSTLYKIYKDPENYPVLKASELVNFALGNPWLVWVADLFRVNYDTSEYDDFNLLLSELFTIINDLEEEGISQIYLTDYFEIIDDLQTGNIDEAKGKIDELMQALHGGSDSLSGAADDATGATVSGGVAGLAGALDASHGAFAAAINDLNDLSVHTQTRLSEVEGFFSVLADRMGITYGQGVNDTVISNLTQTEYQGPKYQYVQVPWTFVEFDIENGSFVDRYKLVHPQTGAIIDQIAIPITYDPNRPNQYIGGTTHPSPQVVQVSNYAKGGYSDIPAIFGEAGGEWAVPAYGNPNNENFLKSVGASPENIAQVILSEISTGKGKKRGKEEIRVELSRNSLQLLAQIMKPAKVQPSKQDINVVIDENAITNAWNRKARNNRQTQRILKRELVRA